MCIGSNVNIEIPRSRAVALLGIEIDGGIALQHFSISETAGILVRKFTES